MSSCGFNPLEKYEPNWSISRKRYEHKKYGKPLPRNLFCSCVRPPRKLTWNLKANPWKRRFLLGAIIFRFHVSFCGSIVSYTHIDPSNIHTTPRPPKHHHHPLPRGMKASQTAPNHCNPFTPINRTSYLKRGEIWNFAYRAKKGATLLLLLLLLLSLWLWCPTRMAFFTPRFLIGASLWWVANLATFSQHGRNITTQR